MTLLAVEDVVIRKVVYLVCGAIFGLLIGMLLGGLWWLAIHSWARPSPSSCPIS